MATKDEEVDVLLTGFEVFGRHTINPSWEIVKTLNDMPLHGLKVRAHLLPVDYAGVDESYPKILAQYPNLKLIINCGVGSAGSLQLEQIARNGPYTRLDNSNSAPATELCRAEDDPSFVRKTTLPLEDLVADLTRAAPDLQLKTSTDAGLFLCEYTFYNSLRAQRCPAVFFHVPPYGSPYSESVLRLHAFNVLSRLVRHIASASPKALRPKVGLAVLVTSKAYPGCVIVGRRKSAHSDGNPTGKGSWALPGGHLEFGESFEACAAREVAEECGLNDLTRVRHVATVNSIDKTSNYHYVVPFVAAETSGEPVAMEKDKCDAWEWRRWSDLPQPLFAPLAQLKATAFDPFASSSSNGIGNGLQDDKHDTNSTQPA
ncbi:MutT/nudix family protein [Salpingoeca rosetta]|uniref:MutT/nudix family protein n=1 Tax=Salpingoeca rosetta (strain ATCC 50818 / BSB-021) TaxID=946362 RepID=F2U7H0_SALR5|nr:MutT/nudix family protein [Salpingoeca rosetta]EGD83387.1 MutT/nudix family protein [Salpingoeca rosetta]|eukprot:XP_004994891.1 MutT/nudix family protein [Salpingoeca rosetta]